MVDNFFKIFIIFRSVWTRTLVIELFDSNNRRTLVFAVLQTLGAQLSAVLKFSLTGALFVQPAKCTCWITIGLSGLFRLFNDEPTLITYCCGDTETNQAGWDLLKELEHFSRYLLILKL